MYSYWLGNANCFNEKWEETWSYFVEAGQAPYYIYIFQSGRKRGIRILMMRGNH